MANGANGVHLQLREALEDYIKSQYFGKSPILLSAVQNKLDQEGILYQKPYIESSPAYKSELNGIQKSSKLPDWVKAYFDALANADLGVYSSPFCHQVEALEAAFAGKDLFVSTGTGSGKTECFMWPLLAKLAAEARNTPANWSMRGVRTIIMYPMNALVSDQVSRLRRLIGDSEHRFVNVFRETCGEDSRRPQFGMYTGRTPYAGKEPKRSADRSLVATYSEMLNAETNEEKAFLQKLIKDGKFPVKEDFHEFLRKLYDSKHIPDDEDAELVTRFEMQRFCPDILITNYSMLEYMLLRPIESKIWADTQNWLNADSNNKLLFVIDEAHMYRGSAGGEVSFLIRRLFHRLGIDRSRVQFILTTASMPNKNEEDRRVIQTFANDLTASDDGHEFHYLAGQQEEIGSGRAYDIPFDRFTKAHPESFEGDNAERLLALNKFWEGIIDSPAPFSTDNSAYQWLYDHLVDYVPFRELFKLCRGTTASLQELAQSIFPGAELEDAFHAVGVMLAIAPLARSGSGSVLFPARMHMLFRGIKGVYACTNPECSCAHTENGLTLGEVYFTDGNLTCKKCGSTVYELYNDRRCGSIFFRGFVLKQDFDDRKRTYLWHYPGMMNENEVQEIHLFVPSADYQLPEKQGKNKIQPCYLDVCSGFVDFSDDSLDGSPGIRKLYYGEFTTKARPDILTFSTCPHCRHELGKRQLTSFSTRGNQSFFNLIKAQFAAQPAVPEKVGEPDRLPNEGRKILLFSDSRQRAAKLARDMSDASDATVARQLAAIAIDRMEHEVSEQSMNYIYDYFAMVAVEHHVQIFHDSENEKQRERLVEHGSIASKNYKRAKSRGQEYHPRFSIDNALYEEGIIPTYSFPKNVVSTYISGIDGKVKYQVERGLDVAIGEYAPGRAIVVDKTTYQIGGLYYPGGGRTEQTAYSPARAFIQDASYCKNISICTECGWFGLDEDHPHKCPFCGNDKLTHMLPMLRPWGFAPRDAKAIEQAQLSEEYTATQQPLYSTLPDADDVVAIKGYSNTRMAVRPNQRIIMLNKGIGDKGFTICCDCGAAMPGDDPSVLKDIMRPYRSKFLRTRCKHNETKNVNLGYDFITDMLVLEIALDRQQVSMDLAKNSWLNRAGQSLAEALRLSACQELDIEFTELVTGFRVRQNQKGDFIDIYLYDSLSSGAGYAVSIEASIQQLLIKTRELLSSCNCDSACHKCLKHYRNQYVHGLLDRSAALDLLTWAEKGVRSPMLPVYEQRNLLQSVEQILQFSGVHIDFDHEPIEAESFHGKKRIVVYPAMWARPTEKNMVFVSDSYLKYAKPYALKTIVDGL